MRTFAAVTMVAVMTAASALAQQPEAPKPGPEHEMLKKKEGTWTTVMKSGGAEFKGMVTYKMELGGLWLTGSLESELFGAKFSGRSLESYHAAKKKYVSVWVDSMGTAPVTMEGIYDKEKKMFAMAGEGPGMDGKMTKYRSEAKMPDADTMMMTMWIGDGKDSMFTITYKRKK